MVIKDILQKGARTLSGSDSPLLDARLILEHILKKGSVYLTIHRDEELPDDICMQFDALIMRRSAGEPIAYILGKKEFMGLEFTVSPSVLIPRPDTETLVEYAKEFATGRVLDIGTGSGCIAISLKKYRPELTVFALDKSRDALMVAKNNADANNTHVSFICADILKNDIDGVFDTIISNPPYINTEVIPTLMRDVKNYEPYMALDGGADGLTFYKRITYLSKSHLTENGLLAYEVGHDQAEAVCDIMKDNGFGKIDIIKDLSGICRVVAGRLK